MDEILIEEKKYISSRQAAKLTGYAKDYIGQLCREGRVPARLIGRSWYVLEAAIQDHRFGNPEIGSVEKEKKDIEALNAISTWESPRYEASEEELLPFINRLSDTELLTDTEASVDSQESSQHMQDSWKAWFDRFDHIADTDTRSAEDTVEPVTSEMSEVKIEGEEEKHEESNRENEEVKEVNIPIHTVSRTLYQPPVEEFLPHNLTVNLPNGPVMRKKGIKGAMAIQIIGTIVAVIVAATAVIGSGYFDEYIISISQARMIAGVGLYNK